MNLYPILLTPIYKEMVWGGARLNTIFSREIPSDKTGESWDISCRPNEMGIIENGMYKGSTFAEYIGLDKTKILGTTLADREDFPLLIKLIDANDALSIQVHPGGDNGKSEMWYILKAPHDGQLIIGLKSGTTKEDLAAAYQNGTVMEHLNRLTVKEGDIIDIPAGLVHALTPGVMVAEVQQNSDTTYRLYDYGRLGLDGKPRPLHVQEALDASDFTDSIPKQVAIGNTIKKGENALTYSICNPYFAIIKYSLATPIEEASNPAAFSIFTCVEGSAVISTPSATVEIPTGRSVFIPAAMGQYTITPTEKAVLLKSAVQL